MPKRTRRTWAIATAAALTGAVALASPAYAAPNNNSVKKLTKAVTLEGVIEHLEAFQAIADVTATVRPDGPVRGIRDYVVAELEAAGYAPSCRSSRSTTSTTIPLLARTVGGTTTTYVDGEDFLRNRFDTGIPEGTATGTLSVGLVDLPSPPNSNTSGCTVATSRVHPANSDRARPARRVRLRRQGSQRAGRRGRARSS